MLIRDHWKKSYRMLLVSTLLVFMLNTMPAAATFVDYEDQVRWDLGVISEMLEIIYTSLETYLPDISEWLETATGLIGTIQLRVDTLISQLESTNTYLSVVSTKLDGVATMVTKLNTANTYLSWIDSDVEDVLSELETATDLIGIIQLRADTLISQLESTNTYLYQVSTKLDGVSTMVIDLARAKTYLSSIDSDVEDVLSELETATGLIGLMQVDVDALVTAQGVSHDLLAELSSKLTTMIEKQETAFDYLSDLSGDLGTVISNQSAVLPVMQEASSKLSSIYDALLYNDKEAAQYLYMINYNMHSRLDSMIGNQEAILALLQQDGAFTMDLSGVLADLGTVISNQSAALPVLQEVSSKLSSIYDALLYDDKEAAHYLLSIYDALMYNDKEAAEYLYMINNNMHSRLDSVIGNQEAILALLQQDGAFATDLSGVLADLDTMISNQGTALPVLQEVSSKLSSIYDALLYDDKEAAHYLLSIHDTLMYNDKEAAEYLYIINNNMHSRLDSVIGNQETGIENQQKLIELIEDLELTTNVTIENIENITIDVTNKAYEVFYITDSDGNKQNISDFSGDVLTVGGRLLNFFFKVAFDDALDSVDAALDDMTEFYLDDSVVLDGGASLWE